MKSLALIALLLTQVPPADAPVADGTTTVTITEPDVVLLGKYIARLERENASYKASVDTAHHVIIGVVIAAVVAVVAASATSYALGAARRP